MQAKGDAVGARSSMLGVEISGAVQFAVFHLATTVFFGLVLVDFALLAQETVNLSEVVRPLTPEEVTSYSQDIIASELDQANACRALRDGGPNAVAAVEILTD